MNRPHSAQLAYSLKPPFEEFYQKHFVASVEFVGGRMVVLGSKKELRKAKNQTHFCYVKDIRNQQAIKLNLAEGQWVIAECNS
jgi:hypothetical protein